jgi:1-deoxy-D-xylulose-5-phosphate synthase
MMKTALELPGPSAIRYPRGAVAGVGRKPQAQAIPVGKAEVLQDGSDVAILGLGPLTAMARELATRLEREGFSVAVINPRFVKPLDREMLDHYAKRVAAFVTFEDHVKMGGFGSAVIEALDEMGYAEMGRAVPVVRIGWPDRFIEHGKIDDLRARYGLSVDEAQAQVLPLLTQRQRVTLAAS